MARQYQYNYSALKPSVFDARGRERKADTCVRVCRDFFGSGDLRHMTLLDVGSSTGIIDNFLADHFGQVYGRDIDEPAMRHAQERFDKPNLDFARGDAMALAEASDSMDVVVCSHVYEHVPDASRMFDEIFRVLKPGGACYFSGNNRLMYMEPHYQLPFLSLLPRPLAHLYLRVTGKGTFYHEKHVSYWTLRKLCSAFEIHDYSARVIREPEKFGVEYMLKPGTAKQRLASVVATKLPFLTPHIWMLQKPPRKSHGAR